MKGVREGYIDVPGGRIWYRMAGIGGKGAPLLVLHGGPGAPHDYLEPLEVLADERPVVFYDQLGCGNSDKPDDPSLWTIARHVAEIECVRKALGLERVHILGQSWGSMLAVDYMLTKKPAGVMGLIFSGPCLSASRFAADQRANLSRMPEETQKTITGKEASGEFDSPEYQEAMLSYYRLHVRRLSHWPDCLNRTLEKFGQTVYRYMWGPSEFTVTGTLKDYERAERLKEITLPTLYTCGRFDESTPEATAYYNGMHPGSEIVVFEDASHSHHLEKPKEYLATVRDFLHRVESGSNK